MTRDEAIELLQNTAFFGRSTDDIDSAIRMAIEALKTQPCDKDWKFYFNHGYAQAKRDLEKQPCEDGIVFDDYQEGFIPCEDAVSREAVIELIDNSSFKNDHEYKLCRDRAKALPSVPITQHEGGTQYETDS